MPHAQASRFLLLRRQPPNSRLVTKLCTIYGVTILRTRNDNDITSTYPACSGGVKRKELLQLRPREVPNVLLALHVAAHDRPPQTVLEYLCHRSVRHFVIQDQQKPLGRKEGWSQTNRNVELMQPPHCICCCSPGIGSWKKTRARGHTRNRVQQHPGRKEGRKKKTKMNQSTCTRYRRKRDQEGGLCERAASRRGICVFGCFNHERQCRENPTICPKTHEHTHTQFTLPSVCGSKGTSLHAPSPAFHTSSPPLCLLPRKDTMLSNMRFRNSIWAWAQENRPGVCVCFATKSRREATANQT